MDFETFCNKYDLNIGDVETINPNTARVMFDKRRIFLKDKFSGEILNPGQIIDDIEINDELRLILMQTIFERDFEK